MTSAFKPPHTCTHTYRKCAVEIILCLAFKKKKNLLYLFIYYIQKNSSMPQQNFKVKLGLQPSSPAFRSLDLDIIFHLPLRNPDLSGGPPSRLPHSQHPPGLAVLMEPMTGTTFFPLSFPDPELGSLPVFCFVMLMIKEKKEGFVHLYFFFSAFSLLRFIFFFMWHMGIPLGKWIL